MDPIIWGPHLWFYMHTLSFNYPEKPNAENIENHLAFFENLKFTLPCENCRKHYIKFYENNKIDDSLVSRQKLIEWVLDLHNDVNRRNNKPQWSLDKLKKYYKEKYSEEPENPLLSYAKSIKLLLALFLVIILMLKKYKKI